MTPIFTRIRDKVDQLRGRDVLHSRRFETQDRYVTGTGQVLVSTHPETLDCQENYCVIHNPSPEAEALGRTHWRGDRNMMERVCKHGVGHPDPDAQAWAQRTFGDSSSRGVHGCDGCCRYLGDPDRGHAELQVGHDLGAAHTYPPGEDPFHHEDGEVR